jgi:hypothetical protein
MSNIMEQPFGILDKIGMQTAYNVSMLVEKLGDQKKT